MFAPLFERAGLNVVAPRRGIGMGLISLYPLVWAVGRGATEISQREPLAFPVSARS
jgi:hypothetical protein